MGFTVFFDSMYNVTEIEKAIKGSTKLYSSTKYICVIMMLNVTVRVLVGS